MDNEKPSTSEVQDFSTLVNPRTHPDRPTILPANSPKAEDCLDSKAVKKLFHEHGFLSNCPDGMTTLLHGAAGYGLQEAVRYLVEDMFIDTNIKDDSHYAPLHNAVAHRHYGTVEFLIKNGASVNIRGLSGVTPLHLAALNGDLPMYKLLREHGGDIFINNDFGETPSGLLRNFYESVTKPETGNNISLKGNSENYTGNKVQDETIASQTLDNTLTNNVACHTEKKMQTGSKSNQSGKKKSIRARNNFKQTGSMSEHTGNKSSQTGNKDFIKNEDVDHLDNKPEAIRKKCKRTYTREIDTAGKDKVRKKDPVTNHSRRNEERRPKSSSTNTEYRNDFGDDDVSVRSINSTERRCNPASAQYYVGERELAGTEHKDVLSLAERGNAKVMTNLNTRAPEDELRITVLKSDLEKLPNIKDRGTVNSDKMLIGDNISLSNQNSATTALAKSTSVNDEDHDADCTITSLLPDFESLGVKTEKEVMKEKQTEELEKLNADTQEKVQEYIQNKPPRRKVKSYKRKKCKKNCH